MQQRVQSLRVKNDMINAKEAKTDYPTYNFLKTYEKFADAAASGTPVSVGGSTIPFNKESVQ